MATYATLYRIAFTNELTEDVQIDLQRKDATGGPIQEYAAVSVKHAYSGSEGKYTPVIGSSLAIQFDIRETDKDYWPDFADMEKDTWLCVATKDGQPFFRGFVVPDEGEIPFQDPPYTASITATDGIGLLKDIALVNPDGTSMSGANKIITYLAFALQQTGLQIPIRVYDNVFHSSMNNRDDDPKYDFFSQAQLEYRTFLKDATTFTDCYNVLEILLTDNYRIFQWKAQWVVIRIAMLQYVPYVSYYTIHDYNGANPVGFEDDEGYASVGKNELIYPHNEDQLRTIKKADKSTKTSFNYNVWPEIPRNNKFDRGDEITTGTAYDEEDLDNDGDTSEVIGTYKTYKLEDWVFGKNVTGRPSPTNIQPTSSFAYSKRIFNSFNIEIDRQILLQDPTSLDPAQRNVLFSEGIPVSKGDKFSVSFDFRSSFSSTGATIQICSLLLIPDVGGASWWVRNNSTNQSGPFSWLLNSGNAFVSVYYDITNTNQWVSYTIDPGEIPINGTLYVGLVTQGIGSVAHFKNFNIDYKAFIAGGYIQVKGEYWQTTGNKNYPDKSESEVFLSDNAHKIFKGSLLDLTGKPFTPSWYRMGLSEGHPYNYYTNKAKFNHEYRRFWFIEGSFTGTSYATANQSIQQYMGLHKVYRMADLPEDRRFMLTAPIEIDLVKGWTTARFHEVLATPEASMEVEPLARLLARIVSTINATTEAEWTTGGSAPAHGTLAFPPIATGDFFLLGARKDAFGVYIDAGHTMTPNVVNIGGSTSATFTKYFSALTSGIRIELFAVGGTLTDGDVFTLSAYGHSIGIAVEKILTSQQDDGMQVGVTEFKYIF